MTRSTFILISAMSVARAANIDVTCGADASNDAATLNNTISASGTGDAIRVRGTCIVNATIVLFGNRSYLGDSRSGTIIQQAPGANLAAMVASDSWVNNATTTGNPIRIAHMTLDASKATNTTASTHAVVIRSWLSAIEDLVVENARGDGIRVSNPSANNTMLANTQVNGRIIHCYVTGFHGIGIHVVDSGNSVTDWDLLENQVSGGGGQSTIYLDDAAGWRIAGNHLYAVQQHAIHASRCFGTSIESNYIENFGGAGGSSNTYYGIACTLQGSVASVIAGNKVFMFNGEPSAGSLIFIGVPTVNYGPGEVTVTDNAIYGQGGPPETGLSYKLGGGSSLNVLSNNNVQHVGSARYVGSGVTIVTGQ
jgi:hypothetical protein